MSKGLYPSEPLFPNAQNGNSHGASSAVCSEDCGAALAAPLSHLPSFYCRHLGHPLSQIQAFHLVGEDAKADGVDIHSLVIPKMMSSCQQCWALGALILGPAGIFSLQQQQRLHRWTGLLVQIPYLRGALSAPQSELFYLSVPTVPQM